MPQDNNQSLKPAKDGAIVLLPGEKFFVRRVPLDPTGDAASQAGLALEGLSPFPAGQLFHGFRTDTARTCALVFAAYRRNFTPEETATWNGAAAVLPEFAVWLAVGSVPAAGLWVREHAGRVEVVAWDGRSELPAAILVRPAAGMEREALIAETRQKAGLAAGAPVKIFSSAVEAAREKRELVVRLAGGAVEARFDTAALGQADVRDKVLLTERRRTLRRDTLLWRGFAAAVGGLAACVLLELGLLATHGWLRVQQGAVDAQKPMVARIDLAQSLARRLEQFSAQRVLPFEMLAAVYEKRPNSVQFTRISTNGLWRMDIEAQTDNAADLRDFEAGVRKLATIEHVELRDPRTREGLTTFLLEVTFKPGTLKPGGGA
jgi:hypothetical protein